MRAGFRGFFAFTPALDFAALAICLTASRKREPGGEGPSLLGRAVSCPPQSVIDGPALSQTRNDLANTQCIVAPASTSQEGPLMTQSHRQVASSGCDLTARATDLKPSKLLPQAAIRIEDCSTRQAFNVASEWVTRVSNQQTCPMRSKVQA